MTASEGAIVDGAIEDAELETTVGPTEGAFDEAIEEVGEFVGEDEEGIADGTMVGAFDELRDGVGVE